MTEINQLENFDAVYRKELELQRELEKIEIAYVKTVEKYGEYSDLKSFVEYLRTVEKVFTEAKFRNWDAERNKNELIKAKINLLSADGIMAEDILNSIYDDFKKAGSDVGKVYVVVNQLLEKYQENAECKEFILYLQYLYINFQSALEEKISMSDLKTRLIKARMEVLASDGNPELIVLERIYDEFKKLLEFI